MNNYSYKKSIIGFSAALIFLLTCSTSFADVISKDGTSWRVWSCNDTQSSCLTECKSEHGSGSCKIMNGKVYVLTN